MPDERESAARLTVGGQRCVLRDPDNIAALCRQIFGVLA
jgi:hypothetical protein